MVFLSPDQPMKPTLEMITDDPTDGDVVSLSCNVTPDNDKINGYQFFHEGKPLSGKVNDKVYILTSSTHRAHNGNYTCVAFIDSVVSEASDAVTISGMIFKLIIGAICSYYMYKVILL